MPFCVICAVSSDSLHLLHCPSLPHQLFSLKLVHFLKQLDRKFHSLFQRQIKCLVDHLCWTCSLSVRNVLFGKYLSTIDCIQHASGLPAVTQGFSGDHSIQDYYSWLNAQDFLSMMSIDLQMAWVLCQTHASMKHFDFPVGYFCNLLLQIQLCCVWNS